MFRRSMSRVASTNITHNRKSQEPMLVQAFRSETAVE